MQLSLYSIKQIHTQFNEQQGVDASVILFFSVRSDSLVEQKIYITEEKGQTSFKKKKNGLAT